MRAMERIGILVGVFAFTMATIYGFWTASTTIGIEWVGVIGLILGGLLGFMIAWYLWMTRRRLERDPSDDPLGDIDEIQGEYGFFSPHSWWPLFLGAAAAVCFARPRGRLVAVHHRRLLRDPGAGRLDLRVLEGPERAVAAHDPRAGHPGRPGGPLVVCARVGGFGSAPAELVQGVLLDAEVVGDLVHHGHGDLVAQLLVVLAHPGQRAAEQGDPVGQRARRPTSRRAR